VVAVVTVAIAVASVAVVTVAKLSRQRCQSRLLTN
jgi:hypothetical protein